MRKQIDLTTLPGWANLSSGNHTIKIKAKGTGYIDSELSAGVVVSKAPSTVTLEKGTYKWVDNPDLIKFSFVRFSYTTVGVTYLGMSIAKDYILYSTHVFGTYGYFKVYESVSGKKPYWGYYDDDHNELNVENTACQTITLATDQTVSAEFYKWAITDGNLVKQAAGETWLLNEGVTPTTMSVSIPFVSNGNTFSSIDMIGDKPSRYAIQYDTTLVFEGLGGWSNTAYRTITFETAPTGGLLTWLQANATPQS